MHTRLTVKQQSKNKLVEREYSFILFDNLTFSLNHYVLRKRATTRHSFKMVEVYNRIRMNTTYYGVMEYLQPPEIPPSVVRAFYAKARSQIKLENYDDVE